MKKEERTMLSATIENDRIVLIPEVDGAEEEDTITITMKAWEEIQQIRQKNNIPAEYGLRMGVKAGGCSGFMYSLGFDPTPRNDDVIYEVDGIKIYIDPKSLFYLMGVQLDFVDDLLNRGFTFRNPRAVRTCGCGNSFAV